DRERGDIDEAEQPEDQKAREVIARRCRRRFFGKPEPIEKAAGSARCVRRSHGVLCHNQSHARAPRNYGRRAPEIQTAATTHASASKRGTPPAEAWLPQRARSG